MRYNIKKNAKTAVLSGLAGLVLLAAAGCESAASRGATFTLAKFEYGAKTTRSKEPEIQKQVIDADAKYQETADVVPGRLGISYK